jgi:hypothetical protein
MKIIKISRSRVRRGIEKGIVVVLHEVWIQVQLRIVIDRILKGEYYRIFTFINSFIPKWVLHFYYSIICLMFCQFTPNLLLYTCSLT